MQSDFETRETYGKMKLVTWGGKTEGLRVERMEEMAPVKEN